MAPPQVDLTKKQPLEDVTGWAEKVGEHKLPPLPPTAPDDDAVAVETSTTVAGRRMLARKRCKFLVIGIVLGVIIAGVVVAAPLLALRHKLHKHWKGHVEHDGHRGEEDYEADGVKHVIHITRDENDNFYRMRAVLDYDRVWT
nr:hypothetical protein BaRGS_009322 [Batillaria attramentaria]